jgi:hypothetical protein
VEVLPKVEPNEARSTEFEGIPVQLYRWKTLPSERVYDDGGDDCVETAQLAKVDSPDG